MKKYLSQLSRRQRFIGLAALIIFLGLLFIAMRQGKVGRGSNLDAITIDMSIKDIALQFKLTGKELAAELKLPPDIDKQAPLKDLNVTPKQLKQAVHHLAGHFESTAKYYIYATLAFWGWIVLVFLGRPALGAIEQKRIWYPGILYVIPLILSVLIAGFYFGKSPNPMEGIVKVFKSMSGLYPDIWGKVCVFLFFIALSIVGNRIICGWGCPFGALQELIHKLPVYRKIKQKKIPFVIKTVIRTALFILALLILFGWTGNRRGFVVYHYLNPFNLFNLEFESNVILLAVSVSLILSFVIYRPFCSFICPFGLVSWLLEPLSLYRVKVDAEKCNKCMACVKACPTGATAGKIEKKIIVDECYSCMRCLNVCPVDAISYDLGMKNFKYSVRK